MYSLCCLLYLFETVVSFRLPQYIALWVVRLRFGLLEEVALIKYNGCCECRKLWARRSMVNYRIPQCLPSRL